MPCEQLITIGFILFKRVESLDEVVGLDARYRYTINQIAVVKGGRGVA